MPEQPKTQAALALSSACLGLNFFLRLQRQRPAGAGVGGR